MIAAMAPPSSFAGPSARDEFDAAVRSDSRRLYAVALSILRDPSEAEDAVQETMMRAWRAWGSLRPGGNRSAWLTRICVNHSISRRRSGWRKFFSLDDSPREPVDPKAEAAFDPVDPDLDRACRRLSAHQRAVITLHYQHGYSLDECADILGSAPGTVRSHLNRALTALRKELGSA